MAQKTSIILFLSIFLNLFLLNDINAQLFSAPDKHFNEYEKPKIPDYALESSWAALPNILDAADLYPQNSTYKEDQKIADVDVFYIHPTTYRNAKNWNQDINLKEVNDWTDLSRVSRQASIFNACCKVFAPRYRQAAFGATSTKDGSGKLAYDFAYQDILSSWKYYVENFNQSRPFIIVGHSQGALHAMTLIQEYIDKSPLSKKMVAAYVIGIPVLKGQIKSRLKNISICKNISDINCIISWNTYKKGSNTSLYKKMALNRLGHGFKTKEDRSIICWNPTQSFQNTHEMRSMSNLGPLPTDKNKDQLPNLANSVSAFCKDGILFTSPPESSEFNLFILPGGSLHMHDMELFYENIRINAIKRIKYFLSSS